MAYEACTGGMSHRPVCSRCLTSADPSFQANKKIQTADVKKTIKRYTTLRDAATVKQQLAQMAEWEKAKGQSGDLSSSMEMAESSSSSEGALRDSSGWKSASSGGAGMKGAIGEARKKKVRVAA